MAEKDEKLENKEEVNKTKTAEKKDKKVENKKEEKQEKSQENKPAKNEQEENKPVEKKPEEKKPEETKKTDKKENKDEQKIEFEKSYFDGGLLQLIGWKLLGALVTLITFGICYPFALCFIYKWQMKHTVINGKRLYFDGKGYQLLGRWLLWLLLSIITLGIYTLWIPVQQNKWILKHTHYEGVKDTGEKDENNKSQFDGTTLQYIGWILLAVFISVFSVGILFPCALCLVYNWRISHTVIDGDRMEFDGKSLQLLGLWIKWVLLSIITIGIYSLWIPISLLKWETKHTNKKGLSEKPYSVKKAIILPVIAVVAIFLCITIGSAMYTITKQKSVLDRGSFSLPGNSTNEIAKGDKETQKTKINDAKDYSDGVAWVRDENNKVYLIDEKGKEIFELGEISRGLGIPDSVENFIDGYAKVKDEKSERIIDKKGKTVLTINDEMEVENSGDGFAIVETDEEDYLGTTEKMGLYDLEKQEYILEPSANYTRMKYLGEGMFLVLQKEEGSYKTPAFIFNTETAQTVKGPTEDRYIEEMANYNNGYAVAVKDGTFCLIDKNGNEKTLGVDGFYGLTTGKYAEGLIYIKEAFYDENGNKVIDLTDQNVSNYPVFVDGYALVTFDNGSNDYYTIMDKTGEFLFEPKKFISTDNVRDTESFAIYDDQEELAKGGYIFARENSQYKVIDIHGETKLQLDRLERPDSGITEDGIISIYNTQTSEHYYKNLDGDKITIEVK